MSSVILETRKKISERWVNSASVTAIFWEIIRDVSIKQRRRIIHIAIVTATLLLFAFLFAGETLVRRLGISANHLNIGGGLILLLVCVRLLVPSQKAVKNKEATKWLAIMPLGIPIIAGPGTLTISLVSARTNGLFPTFTALIISLLIVLIALRSAERLRKRIGQTIAQKISKVVMVLIAILATKMVISGLTGFISH